MSDELKNNLESIIQIVNFVGKDWSKKEYISQDAYMGETLRLCEGLYGKLKDEYKFLKTKKSHKDLEKYFMSPDGITVFDTMYTAVSNIIDDDNIGSYFSIIDSRIGIMLNDKLPEDEKLDLDYIKVNTKNDDENLIVYFCFPKEMTKTIDEEFEKVMKKKNNDSMFI